MLFILLFLPLCVAVSKDLWIVGGGDALISDFPWQGSLRTSTNFSSCGCVLIATNWALTAVHCGGDSTYTTEWGMDNLGDGLVVDILSVTPHPDYNEGTGTMPNDISVIALDGNAEGPNISPITVPSHRMDGGWGHMSGWGQICGTCGTSSRLQAVGLDILKDSEAAAVWKRNYNGHVHICTWDPTNTDTSSCHGDSGGPLVAEGELQGISNFIESNCNPSYPSCYTRVTNYYTWICAQTNNQAKGCVSEAKDDYIYYTSPAVYDFFKHFAIRQKNSYFSFEVSSCNNAVVLVSEGRYVRYETEWSYEVVFGQAVNMKTSIRADPLGPELIKVDTPDILHCDIPREYWVSWTGGLISAGTGDTPTPETTFIEWSGTALTDPWIQFSSWTTYPGEWKFKKSQVSDLEVTTYWESSNIIWIDLSNYVSFDVKACRSAEILLASSYGRHDEAYEVIIGDFSNTGSTVRDSYRGDIVAEDFGADRLSCDEYRHFYIHGTPGYLQVGDENGVFLNWPQPNPPLEVGTISVYSQDATWKFTSLSAIEPWEITE